MNLNLRSSLYYLLRKLRLLPFITAIRSAVIIEKDYGHFKSSLLWSAIDKDGNPIPWLSYPAIEWLKRIDLSKARIFEYGSGNSTIFWAKRCKEIFSVENNPNWYKRILKELKTFKNTALILEEDQKKYIDTISKLNKNFDVIIIDGAYRKSCAKKALKHINKNGMVILDNADWFPNTSKMLRKKGLRQIDFVGFGPINHYVTNTAVFIKNNFLSRTTYTAASSFVLGGLKNLDD